MELPKIAFIPIARPTFDIELATETFQAAKRSLEAAGLVLRGPEHLLTGPEDVLSAAKAAAVEPLDAWVLFQATFADSSMVQALASFVDAPLVLWAVPEALTGGRLRLNSFCGINLAGHALTRRGIDYEHLYAAVDDPEPVGEILKLATAGRVARKLKSARLGRVGEHPNGFDSCSFDEQALARVFGLDVRQLDLSGDVFEATKKIPAARIDEIEAGLSQKVEGLERLDRTAARGTLRVFETLKQLADSERIDGYAVRCWPEFFTELGCAACGAMSMLSDAMLPCSCEADVNGTVTQMILQWISGEPAFGSDMVALDAEQDAVVLWHCGLAPLSMADPSARKGVTVHSNRKLPLLMDFCLKPGVVTLARLSEAKGAYQMVVGKGRILRAPKSFSGTSGVLKFDLSGRDVLNKILDEGLEHHISLTYGDYVDTLIALAKIVNLPVYRLT